MAGAKGEATRARLLASAEALFAAQGYHGTTVSQIVADAGVTQASFYLYFPGKEKLMNELLQRFENRLRQLSNAGEEAGRQPEGKLEAFAAHAMTAMFRLLGENLNLTRIALQGAAGERIRLELVLEVAGNIRLNQSRGVVSPEIEPELAAESLVAAVEYLAYRYLMNGERSVEELGNRAARLFLRGILK
ncbi:TetR/AcrR family transcriptional regulator [Paenibacillus sp. HN-1]|uniref:TetR/AcrR family transcriptional regulator n=1 Tax=Paenibacillus TaxID=44249 RepID=UPI001CA9F762|nr:MULTISPECIES: TetR/AcrR family transcriptional regulator [Paenibacillus]MBY9078387.1 TetR/AcrR family transcriptional regulator [Paenibacillus sp. CGMCC 1.18879]MBY9087898.1 TetR/AcrR family transcriptional regulator [Paenibacillus sinensis]